MALVATIRGGLPGRCLGVLQQSEYDSPYVAPVAARAARVPHPLWADAWNLHHGIYAQNPILIIFSFSLLRFLLLRLSSQSSASS